MPSDLHIDDFYRDTAKTLVLLYNSFPRLITLYVEDIAGPDTPDEFGLHSKRHESCLSTLIWLGNTHYLNYKTLVRREALEETTLSHRAFLLLNSSYDGNGIITDATHGSKALLINQLRYEINSGTSDSLAQQVKSIMALSRELQ